MRVPNPTLPALLIFSTACLGGLNDTGDGRGFSMDFQGVKVSPNQPEIGDFPGLIGAPNLDDDNQDGLADWDEETSRPEENDWVELLLHTEGESIRIELAGESDNVRIWKNDTHVLGAELVDAPLTLSGEQEEILLHVEFGDYLAQARLDVTQVDSQESFSLRLTAAPLVIYHHLDRSERVWMMEFPSNSNGPQNNDAMAQAYSNELGEAYNNVTARTYDWDPWVQDEFEWAVLDTPDGHMGVVIDSIRNGQGQPGSGLDDLPENEMMEPDVFVQEWGEGRGSSLDYFGNLEVSPPVTVDGVRYPFGRVYTGGKGAQTPRPQLTDFLASQQLQDPFMVDSTWLCVGHIDEYTTFIPDPDSPKGFRLLITNTNDAWDLLESMPSSTALPKYAQRGNMGYGIDTVGELLNTPGLRQLNDEIQELYLDTQLARFKEELGLTDEDVIFVPGLFEEPLSMCGPYAAALVPGMVNLIIAQDT
ncbi:MAG: protein-arginine deiminase family protein, partial [Myxococcota bacterium]|nr:protein-arginine deiminase family protein [Myxococcota bacterium]